MDMIGMYKMMFVARPGRQRGEARIVRSEAGGLPSKKKLTYCKRFELLKNLIWKDAEVEGDSSVVVRRQLVRRGSSPYKYK